MNFILFENASGYALFERLGEDEIEERNIEVQQQYQSFELFSKVVKLRSWYIFESLQVALENINDLSEGVLNATLENFLENNLPKSSKVVLGVVDEKIGLSIKENLRIKIERSPVVNELVRSIRLHFSTFIKRLAGDDIQIDYTAAQKGLAHAYSRSKVKFNVNKADIMVIHGIALLNQLVKDVNIFSMRLREWYSRHFPELGKIVPDNYLYARCVALIGSRSNLSQKMTEGLKEILKDDDKVQEVFNATGFSMGFDLSEIDMACINNFARRVVSITKHRECIEKYLITRMNEVAPNLSALIGETLGATLISRAGSLTNLSKYPASTIQVLGAEKALFRAIKSRGNTPKYGSIYNSSFIGRAKAKDKGRISRYLANKCSLASRLDAFGDVETSLYGLAMKQQVEDRLYFYETGKNPARNLDVMKAISEELSTKTNTTDDIANEQLSSDQKRKREHEETEHQSSRADSSQKKRKVEGDDTTVTEKKKSSSKKSKHKSEKAVSKIEKSEKNTSTEKSLKRSVKDEKEFEREASKKRESSADQEPTKKSNKDTKKKSSKRDEESPSVKSKKEKSHAKSKNKKSKTE